MTQHSNSDAEDAVADLEAVAEQIYPYLGRLDGLLELMSKHGGGFDSTFPKEFHISIADLYSVHSAGERAFLQYISFYPKLRNEWISATFDQFKMTFAVGLRGVMAEKYVILRRCAGIVRAKAMLPIARETQPTTNYFGDFHMGDRYIAHQAGAVGPNANASDFTLYQVSTPVDLEKLAQELKVLRLEMEANQDASPERARSVEQVRLAESAARNGDNGLVLTHLKKAGSWAFDTATKIGVSVASEVIKSSIGLK